MAHQTSLDDVMYVLAPKILGSDVPVTTVLAFGKSRVARWMRVDEDAFREHQRTRVPDLLRASDAPCETLAVLIDEYRRVKQSPNRNFARTVGRIGDIAQLRVLTSRLLGVNTTLVFALLGCAETDNVELARCIHEDIGWDIEEVAMTASRHGSLRMLKFVHDRAPWALEYVMDRLDDECPKDVATARLLLELGASNASRFAIGAIRCGRVDLMRADPDLFWNEAAFECSEGFASADVLRFAFERSPRLFERPVHVPEWFVTHWRDRVACLEFYMLTARNDMRLTAECFAFARDEAELDALLRLGAPWPARLSCFSHAVVDAALRRADCPVYADWPAHAGSVETVRACLARGWPVGELTSATSHEVLRALGARDDVVPVRRRTLDRLVLLRGRLRLF